MSIRLLRIMGRKESCECHACEGEKNACGAHPDMAETV